MTYKLYLQGLVHTTTPETGFLALKTFTVNFSQIYNSVIFILKKKLLNFKIWILKTRKHLVSLNVAINFCNYVLIMC